jgi:hypothetical protein
VAEVAKQLRSQDIDHLLLDLQISAAALGEIEIDLQALAQLERPAGAVLSNALVGTLGTLPLKIKAPARTALPWFEASGLAFAVANRDGPTSVEGAAVEPDKARWRRSWRPGSELPWRELVGGEQAELFDPSLIGETRIRPSLYGPGHAAFVNPHLAARPSNGAHPLNTVIWPWLNRLLPTPTSEAARDRFVAAAGRLIDELVGNVAEHARRPAGDTLSSLVQVSLTRGGRGSFNRFHLTVSDNGPGIAATARPKLDPSKAAALSESQLLSKLLEGTLAPWDRARGMGLPKVAELTRAYRGTLRAATKMSRLMIGGDVRAVRTERSGFVLDGTVLTVMLRLPRL